jgi:hypothetical protein
MPSAPTPHGDDSALNVDRWYTICNTPRNKKSRYKTRPAKFFRALLLHCNEYLARCAKRYASHTRSAGLHPKKHRNFLRHQTSALARPRDINCSSAITIEEKKVVKLKRQPRLPF